MTILLPPISCFAENNALRSGAFILLGIESTLLAAFGFHICPVYLLKDEEAATTSLFLS